MLALQHSSQYMNEVRENAKFEKVYLESEYMHAFIVGFEE
jgi:hypothetical protein